MGVLSILWPDINSRPTKTLQNVGPRAATVYGLLLYYRPACHVPSVSLCLSLSTYK